MFIVTYVSAIRNYRTCKNGDYVHRKHNVIMDEISNLCKAANLLVESESFVCFNDRTNNTMDLVVKIKIDDEDILMRLQ